MSNSRQGRGSAARFRTRAKILHLYGLDSIGILFRRGETFQDTGNSPGSSTLRPFVCELSAQKSGRVATQPSGPAAESSAMAAPRV